MSVPKTFPCQWYASALGTLFLFVKNPKRRKTVKQSILEKDGAEE